MRLSQPQILVQAAFAIRCNLSILSAVSAGTITNLQTSRCLPLPQVSRQDGDQCPVPPILGVS